MLNKKILLSILIIGLVSVLAGSSTWARFSDSEENSGNSIAAGTLNLTLVDNPLLITNAAPGDSGTNFKVLKNKGTLSGKLTIYLSTVTNAEGTSSEFQVGGSGDLGMKAKMALWIDKNKNGVFDVGSDVALKYDGTFSTGASPTYYFIDQYSGVHWDNVILSMAPNDEYYFTIDWIIPVDAGNDIQGDSVSFNTSYTLDQ